MEEDFDLEESAAHTPGMEEQRLTAIHAVRSFVLVLLILAVAIVLMITLVLTKPDPDKKESSEFTPAVRVMPLEVSTHQVTIKTQGVVRSLREVTLAAEVGGKVVTKDDALLAGTVVHKGQVLVELEAADYLAAEARAEAALADANLALEQELAMGAQAVADWQKLGQGKQGDLARRKPQEDAARARVKSAAAELERARRDVERTTIRAPFDARVRGAMVEVGAVLAPGTPIAELYSTDKLEVRLPFSLEDYGFLRDEKVVGIVLTATVGGEQKSWPAQIDRIEGEVQRSTLSAYGLARIDPAADGSLPPVGLFVEAKVAGMQLDDVVVLPRRVVRATDEVWVANGGKLAKRPIHILRSGEDEVVVRGEFKEGDALVLTRLNAPLVGMKVDAIEDQAEDEASP